MCVENEDMMLFINSVSDKYLSSLKYGMLLTLYQKATVSCLPEAVLGVYFVCPIIIPLPFWVKERQLPY